MRATWTIAAAVLVTGCGHYGWADRPGPTVSDEPVAVVTVDVPTHRDVDSGAVTRILVARLQQAGVRQAAWRADDDGDRAVACRISFPHAATFGDQIDARALAVCRIGQTTVRREASAQAGFGEDVVDGRRHVFQIVAERAAAAVADPLARAIAAHSPHD